MSNYGKVKTKAFYGRIRGFVLSRLLILLIIYDLRPVYIDLVICYKSGRGRLTIGGIVIFGSFNSSSRSLEILKPF